MLAIVAAGAFWLAAGSAFAAAPDCPVVGAYYRVVFTEDYRAYYDLDTDNTYIIKVDAISRSHPDFILFEYPPNANQSYSSNLAGRRWVNLHYVMDLVPVSGH